MNAAARPQDYAKRTPQVSTLASRTMRIGGFFLLFFIVYHIGHFTTGTWHPAFSHTGVYGNVIRFLFPLTIEDAVFDEGLSVLDAALAEVLA